MRDLYIILLGRISQIVTTIVSLQLMTARLSPNEMGKYTLIFSITSFFSLVFINPISMYINRKMHEWYEEGTLWLGFKMGSYYVYSIALISIFIVVIIHEGIGISWNINIYWLTVLISGNLILSTFNQMIIPSLNMLGKRIEWSVLTLITLASGLLISMILTKKEANAEFWLIGQIIGLSIGCSLAYVPFRRLLKLKESKSKRIYNSGSIEISKIKPIFQFALPIAFAVGLNWIQFQSYKFVVSEVGGLEYLGLFVIGYTVSSGIMNAFESTAMNYFCPIFYTKISESDDKGKFEAWNQYASIMIPLTLYTAIVTIAMASQLTHILVNKTFWISSHFVIYGALTESGRVIGNVYNMVAHATMKTKILIRPQLIGAFISMILVPVLTKLLPFIGVGIALTIAAVVFVYFLHRSVTAHFAVNLKLVDISKKLLLITPIVIISFSSTFISSSFYIDISFLVLSGILYIAASYKILKHSFIK